VFFGIGKGAASARTLTTSPDVIAYRVNVETGEILRQRKLDSSEPQLDVYER
jgi:hypothetical protein